MDTNLTIAIDISHWWRVNWAEVPDYVRVVMVKATEGEDFVDPMLASHVEGALAAGKTVGLYHFYRTQNAGRKAPPTAQAEFFLAQTRPYWGECKLRANDFEQGEYNASTSRHYNVANGSEINDLYVFHQALKGSDWAAFDLLYTDWGTWGDFRMMNAANLWQGPGWIKSEGLVDGLWLAWWPTARPKEIGALENFRIADYQPRLPRPFTRYWMWQVAADYRMPGITNTRGVPRGTDLNLIPQPYAEVARTLGEMPNESGEEEEALDSAYRRGWAARTEALLAYLQETREGGKG